MELHSSLELAKTEKPINFSAENIRSIISQIKTQTRRPVKMIDPNIPVGDEHDPKFWLHLGEGVWAPNDAKYSKPQVCTYGVPGTKLWAREVFSYAKATHYNPRRRHHEEHEYIAYKADYPEDEKPVGVTRWTAPMYLARKNSRILLEVTDVRIERLQKISESDARAEGAKPMGLCTDRHIIGYRHMWNKIYQTKPELKWNKNPWVWVIQFKLVELLNNLKTEGEIYQ